MVGHGYAHLGNEVRDEMAKDFFLRGLKPDIKNWIWNQAMADFQAAVNKATLRELLVNDFGTAEIVRKPKSMMFAPLEDQHGELLKMLGKINLTLERV